MTSKQKLNDALKVNICGKVKRELKKGSLEVYPIKGYGAVEMGCMDFMAVRIKPRRFIIQSLFTSGKERITNGE